MAEPSCQVFQSSIGGMALEKKMQFLSGESRQNDTSHTRPVKRDYLTCMFAIADYTLVKEMLD